MSAAPTWVGVATGSPDGGVAIVRVSGPAAQELAERAVGTLGPARRAALRSLSLPTGVESSLVLFMPGPASFTGEDVVEFQVHGGTANVREVVSYLLMLGEGLGARPAGPGDFARRAFIHGKLSLDQLEGIAAVVAARTDAALSQARRLVAGELGEGVDALRERVSTSRLEVEANLDFPEDVVDTDTERLTETLLSEHSRLLGWLAGFEAGRRAREGWRVVVAGPANAGKSALVNRLAGRTRVLVSEFAGTTRDYVEVELAWGGRSLVLVDTAGFRPVESLAGPQGAIEAAGMELGRAQLDGADVVVWVEAPDARSTVSPAFTGSDGGWIKVFNKSDMGGSVPNGSWLQVSANSGEGLEALREAVEDRFAEMDEPWIGLARHRDRAHEAADALGRALAGLEKGCGLEVVALELGICVARLAEITGAAATGAVGAEVLDGIFARFCIGK